MKNFKSFFSTFLIFSIVLTNIAIFVLPVFAVEKNGINLEQDRINSLSRIRVGDQTATGTLTETNINKQFGIAENKLKEDISKDTPRLETKNYVEGEILVKYKNNKINLDTSLGRRAALSFNTSKSLEKKEDLRKNNISVLRIKDSKTVEQKVAELKNDLNVEYAEPNYKRYPTNINANDPSKDLLWGLDNTGQNINGSYGNITGTEDKDIDAPEAWTINEGTNASVIVAVIDSGVAYNHPDLTANMWDGTNCKNENGIVIPGGCNHGYDYEGDGDNTPLPTDSSHGTHVAGTIAAAKDNSKGIIGVAPQAKIMAIKFGFNIASEIKAIDFAIQNGAKVINASFTGVDFSQSEYDAINRFKAAGGIFVAAAGNGEYYGNSSVGDNHDGQIHVYPSDYNLDNIISVAATDQNDDLATFSDYGTVSVDVGAPGVNIYSAIIDTNSYTENFEGSTYNLFVGGLTTSHWAVGNDGYSKVVYSDKTIPYEALAFTWLESGSIDLSSSNIKRATINFTIWCDTPYSATFNDYIFTEYYSNGSWHGSTKYDEFKIFLNGGSPSTDSGHVGYYKNYTEDISNYLSNDFKFSFDWITDSSIDNNLGCTIDNIKITKFSDGSDEQYGYMNGTSMAAPHVAGLAALIWGTKPNLTYANVKNTILTTGDDLISLATTTATGKRINSFNALDSVTPPIISNIQVATTTETSTTITWSTDLPATSTVSYSTTTPVSSTIVSGGDTATTSHNIGLTDLSPDTTYYFYTKSSDKYGNVATSSEQSFKTLTSSTSRTISGTIKYYDGIKVVRNATVILENDIGAQIASTATDINGIYQFTGIASGEDYVVRVNKSDNNSGLSGADQGKIGRHIVHLELFDSIYKIISGDVNNSGGLSGADQGKIGRFIVGLDSNLPSGAWKFYSSDAILTTMNYLTVGLARTYTNLTTDMSNQDFIGIKMGDVNNSWVSN